MKTIATLLIAAAMLPILTGCERARLDQQVKELCAKDGGIRVYETVKLPPEKFDKYGVVRIPSRRDAKPEDEYFYDNETTYLQAGNPSLRRSYTNVVRRSDSKVLGEAISYHRVGGDIPGPWHPSSFACPKPADLSLEKAIFVRG